MSTSLKDSQSVRSGTSFLRQLIPEMSTNKDKYSESKYMCIVYCALCINKDRSKAFDG